MKVSSIATVLTLLMGSLTSMESKAQVCKDRSNPRVKKGPSGPLFVYRTRNELRTNFEKGDRVKLERKGEVNCGCSYAQTKCIIDGKPCFQQIINGTKAISNGVANYPKLEAQYKLKICNYNEYRKNSELNFGEGAANGAEKSFLKFWKARPALVTDKNTDSDRNGFVKDYFHEAYFSSNSDPITEGQCMKKIDRVVLDTSFSKFYLEAKVEGPLSLTTGNGLTENYCYAYAFQPIDFTYDYGDGKCDFTTEATCIVDPNEPRVGKENVSCEDYINRMTVDDNWKFNATYSWKACNLNDRDVYLQVEASKSSYNTYKRNYKGKYIKKKSSLPPMIPRKDSNNKNCYVADPVDTIIDPMESNFFQINVQGRLYNNDGGKIDFFRDKDCKSFKFANLPKIDSGAIRPPQTGTPSTSSSDSTMPSVLPSISTHPSASLSISAEPSVSPSISTAPSALPSISTHPSLSPSVSAAPYVSPSISAKPSVSPSISAVPSMLPSIGTHPSVSPSISPVPSALPSISTKPSVSPSISDVPSASPSISTKPSVSPSISAKPSVLPSTSVVPSTLPSNSAVPSVSPSISTKLSVSPSDSAVPSVLPSASAVPSASPSISAVPSASPSISAKPSVSPSISAVPSVSPSISTKPSATPSISTAPSVSPSVSAKASVSPSDSAVPSVLPSASTNPSVSPSHNVVPSVLPSASTNPSILLSISAVPSVSPSISTKLSVSPSDSAVPSMLPSASTKPSVSPSISAVPSATPSISTKPTVSPSISDVPPASPSISTKPSVSPSISAKPSASPSISTKPSVSPSISAKPSVSPSISAVPFALLCDSKHPSMLPSISAVPSVPLFSDSVNPSISPSTSAPSISQAPSLSASPSLSQSKSKGKGKGRINGTYDKAGFRRRARTTSQTSSLSASDSSLNLSKSKENGNGRIGSRYDKASFRRRARTISQLPSLSASDSSLNPSKCKEKGKDKIGGEYDKASFRRRVPTVSAAPSISASPTETIPGIKKDVDPIDIANDGWTRCFSSKYSVVIFDENSIIDSCQEGTKVMYGCKSAASPVWSLVGYGNKNKAFSKNSELFGANNINGTVDGDIQWYVTGGSIGFAGKDDNLKLTVCDVEDGDNRLCWHLNHLEESDHKGGFRCGSTRNLNDNSLWERAVWVK